jgi:TRAP-type C4-dicarboxylate transport system permease small subunit
LKRLLDAYCRLLDAVCAALLAGMVVLVAGNVFLRYAFNGGITVSEELSRWMFVWLTFLGAISALHHHGHLGTDLVTSRLGRRGQRALLVIGHVLMLGITGLLFQGALAQARINLDVEAPVSGLPMAWVYGAGVVFAVSTAPMLLRGLWRALAGTASDDELHFVQESEEAAELLALQQRLDAEDAARPAKERA